MIEQTSHRDDAPLATSKEREAAAEAADQLDLPQGDTLLARSVTINRGVSEVFACFRDFANLATFMENVERIEVIDSQRSHWVVKAPGGRTVEWDAVITGEAADSFIAWASAEGAYVAHTGTKAFVDHFTDALRNEIKDADGVTITTLMPGPVETEFFHRAGMDDTKVGSSDTKSNPADVAKDGWDAVMAGKASIVSGWKNKIEQAVANVTPAGVLAEQHRKMAEPGTAER